MSVDSKTNILIKKLAFRIWRKRKRDKEPHVKETWLAFCCMKNLYAPTEPHLTKLLKFSMSTFYFTYIIHTSGDIIRQRKIAHTHEKKAKQQSLYTMRDIDEEECLKPGIQIEWKKEKNQKYEFNIERKCSTVRRQLWWANLPRISSFLLENYALLFVLYTHIS